MESLFSCRNCVFNSSQTLFLGHGEGFCLKFNCVLAAPISTTCRFLYRKDLPEFLVHEAVAEHAAELPATNAPVGLFDYEEKEILRYSERHAWENGFDMLRNNIAQYYKVSPKWVYISSLASSSEARAVSAFTSLVRKYMKQCGKWQSSYRSIYYIMNDLHKDFFVDRDEVVCGSHSAADDILTAKMDVFLSKISVIQEFGKEARVDEFMWLFDEFKEYVIDNEYEKLLEKAEEMAEPLKDRLVGLVKENDAYFQASPEML